MGRPQSKQELLHASNEMYKQLDMLIQHMDEDHRQNTFCFDDRDRNIRDIVIHLYEWHQLLLKWVNANQLGIKQPFLPKPYNWKTYQQLNVEFFNKHQSTDLDVSLKLLKQSHDDVMNLIDGFSDEELFIKKYYDWTGTTSLGSYCVSATSSHYAWAIKKINKYIKMCLS